MRKLIRVLAFVVALLVVVIGVVGLTGAMLPRRHSVTRTVVVAKPVEEVWRVVSDLEHSPSWRSDVTAVRRLPDSGGHPVWEQVTPQGNWPLAITEVAPPSRIVATVADSSEGFGGAWVYELRPEGSGTRVTITESGFIDNPIFRFLATFVFGLDSTLETYLKDLGKHFGETLAPQKA